MVAGTDVVFTHELLELLFENVVVANVVVDGVRRFDIELVVNGVQGFQVIRGPINWLQVRGGTVTTEWAWGILAQRG